MPFNGSSQSNNLCIIAEESKEQRPVDKVIPRRFLPISSLFSCNYQSLSSVDFQGGYANSAYGTSMTQLYTIRTVLGSLKDNRSKKDESLWHHTV